MEFYPLTLGTGRAVAPSSITGAGAQGSAARAVVPNDLKKDILKRDEYTCQCCGFRSEKYQQILFKDQNPANLDPDNLLTSCIFCHQCFDLQHVAEMRSGTLIWLPEITQASLNNMARAIYIARISQGPIAETVRQILDLMMERREEAVRRITTDDPFILATVLNDYLSLKAYQGRESKLSGIRLFPLDRRIIKEADLEFNQFPQILAYWRSKNGPYGGRSPQDWIGIYETVASEALRAA
jgi:intracellular multiplication protein IcmJ